MVRTARPKMRPRRGGWFHAYAYSLLRLLSLLASCVAQFAAGEEWVAKMFAEKKHDFGTVARGADTVYKFPVKNIYKQDVELVSVRSSCGCTSPTIEHKMLKTGETGYVVATFNTRTFTGVHGATLTVEVKWNDNGILRRGETQLRVDGNIRSDVVFKPGAIKFESVDQGAKSEQHVAVTYAGRIRLENHRRPRRERRPRSRAHRDAALLRPRGLRTVGPRQRLRAGRLLQRSIGARHQRRPEPADSDPRRRPHRARDFGRAGTARAGRRRPRPAGVEESHRPRQEAVQDCVGRVPGRLRSNSRPTTRPAIGTWSRSCSTPRATPAK